MQLVVKSQILAGGRGLGTFKNGLKGGVHIVKTEQVEEIAGIKDCLLQVLFNYHVTLPYWFFYLLYLLQFPFSIEHRLLSYTFSKEWVILENKILD